MLGRFSVRYVTIPSISLYRYHIVLFQRHYAGILSYSIQAYTILFMSNELCYAFVRAPFPECRYGSSVHAIRCRQSALTFLRSLFGSIRLLHTTYVSLRLHSSHSRHEFSQLVLRTERSYTRKHVPLIGSSDVC
jgi:hypothetical protein